MTAIVFEHEGTVAKVMGDGMQVLFGAPGDQPDHAERAVACALALDAFSETFRAERRAEGIPLGTTRIGLHSGPALVGDFGGGRYFDYAAHGDTINTAARLEGANKALGTRVCVSTATTERIPGFVGRPVGDLLLRGRSETLRVYEPLPRERCEEPGRCAYAAAFERLAARDPGALAAFAALVGANPTDRLAHFHLRRLLNGETGARVDLP
jgi:adenylate cyclase